MKYDTYETYDSDGNIIESVKIPWDKERYRVELASLDTQLTPRRISEGITSDAGRQWLVDFDAKKQVLRVEMAALDD